MMKHLILFVVLTASMSAQMRDSSYSIPMQAKACVISVTYGGVVIRDTLPSAQTAAWLTMHGLSRADSTRPLQDGILSYLRSEIDRCYGARLVDMQRELGDVDASDTMTLADIRAAKAAIRKRYLQYKLPVAISVPILP